MIEFGCHTWGFNDKPLETALGTIARLGFRYVDLGSGPHIDVVEAAAAPAEAAKPILEQLATFNLKISDLYLMLPRISVADDTRRAHEVASFEKLLPFAVALGTPGITVSPGVSGHGAREEVFPRVATVLRGFMAQAKAFDIDVSIEPHLDSIVEKPDDIIALLSEVEGLTLTLDWAHLTKQGIKPDAAVRLVPYIRHVQVRQAAPLRLQTPFDQGVVDLERVMTLLMSAGYDGVITVENMQTVGWHGAAAVDSIAEAVATRDALRDLRDRFATA
ncbi:MAG: sugar phosphate isomerase/epimerase [Chloroflexota bacterium]